MLLQTKIGYYFDTTSRSNIYPFHVHFQEKYGLAPLKKIILIYTGQITADMLKINRYLNKNQIK